MAMVAIAGDDLVALFQRQLHPDDDGFLTDIEVTETTDESHAVELAGLFLETPDQQHFPVGLEIVFLGEFGDRAAGKIFLGRLGSGLAAGNGRGFSRSHSFLPMVSLWRLP